MKAEYIHLSLINILEFNGQLERFNILFSPSYYSMQCVNPKIVALFDAFSWSSSKEGHYFWQNLHEESNVNKQRKYIGGYILLKFSLIHE